MKYGYKRKKKVEPYTNSSLSQPIGISILCCFLCLFMIAIIYAIYSTYKENLRLDQLRDACKGKAKCLLKIEKLVAEKAMAEALSSSRGRSYNRAPLISFS